MFHTIQKVFQAFAHALYQGIRTRHRFTCVHLITKGLTCQVLLYNFSKTFCPLEANKKGRSVGRTGEMMCT